MKSQIRGIEREKGITLIALVITIIVLLILAGVTIATLTGENGILTKATQARDNTIIAQEKEQVQTAYAAAMMDAYDQEDKTITQAMLQQEMNNLTGENATEVTDNGDGSFNVHFKDTENNYRVDNEGVTEVITEPTETMSLLDMYENGQNCENPDECTDGTHLHIGDFMTYNNPTEASVEILATDTGMDKAGVKVTNQTFNVSATENQLNWQVLGIDEETGGIKLIGDSVIKNSRATTVNDPYFYLYGATGYVNGISQMDKICQMYKNEYATKARAVKVEDIDELFGIKTEEDIQKYDILGEYGTPYTLNNGYTPESYLKNQTVTEQVTRNTYVYYYNIPEEMAEEFEFPTVNSNKVLNLISSRFYINIDGIDAYSYSFATQGCNAAPGSLGYTFGGVLYTQMIPGVEDKAGMVLSASNGDFLFSAERGIEYIEEYLVRPVVILDKNINNQQIRKSNKTFTEEPAQNYVSDPNL